MKNLILYHVFYFIHMKISVIPRNNRILNWKNNESNIHMDSSYNTKVIQSINTLCRKCTVLMKNINSIYTFSLLFKSFDVEMKCFCMTLY